MTFLLELKERWSRFYDKYEKYVNIAARFAIALIGLILLTNEVGFLTVLKSPGIIVPVAVVCAILPTFVTVIALSFFIVMHFFAISTQLAIFIIILFGIMYLIFFRFSPKSVYVLLLTVYCFCFHIPYILPVVLALVCLLSDFIAVDLGIIIYFVLHRVSEYEVGLTRHMSVDNAHTASYIAEGMLGNKEMGAVLLVFTVIFIMVNLIRRSSAQYAWAYAIIFGVISQFMLLVLTDIWFGLNMSITMIVIETLIETAVAFIFHSLFFSADYTKTEHFQFDDENYFYFVKAVPKRNITVSDIKVTHINAKSIKEKRNTIKQETDVDDDTQG